MKVSNLGLKGTIKGVLFNKNLSLSLLLIKPKSFQSFVVRLQRTFIMPAEYARLNAHEGVYAYNKRRTASYPQNAVQASRDLRDMADGP